MSPRELRIPVETLDRRGLDGRTAARRGMAIASSDVMPNIRTVSLPTLMLVAATRGMLGAGIGLLLAGRLGERRVRVGRTLVAIGALSTIPLVRHIFFRQAPADDYVKDVTRFR